ncbi:MAG TPA: hypothetical protein PLO84_02695 [Thermotogota bacterium]|nr:hypothetical protein [Thermotogota bacterium]HPJ88006.1 hypothetical protein [Thermotogota bacterium]
MSLMKESLKEILEISEKLLDQIKNGFPLPDTEKYEDFVLLLKRRESSIDGLKNCRGDRNISEEKIILHKIEKIETEMLTLMKHESENIKVSIDTIEKGKKAVKNGYLSKYGEFSAKSRFSKRG